MYKELCAAKDREQEAKRLIEAEYASMRADLLESQRQQEELARQLRELQDSVASGAQFPGNGANLSTIQDHEPEFFVNATPVRLNSSKRTRISSPGKRPNNPPALGSDHNQFSLLGTEEEEFSEDSAMAEDPAPLPAGTTQTVLPLVASTPLTVKSSLQQAMQKGKAAHEPQADVTSGNTYGHELTGSTTADTTTVPLNCPDTDVSLTAVKAANDVTLLKEFHDNDEVVEFESVEFESEADDDDEVLDDNDGSEDSESAAFDDDAAMDDDQKGHDHKTFDANNSFEMEAEPDYDDGPTTIEWADGGTSDMAIDSLQQSVQEATDGVQKLQVDNSPTTGSNGGGSA